MLTVDPHIEDSIQFVTVGTKGGFTFWRMDLEATSLQLSETPIPPHLEAVDFVSVCYTSYLPVPYKTYLILLGTSEGSLVAYD